MGESGASPELLRNGNGRIGQSPNPYFLKIINLLRKMGWLRMPWIFRWIVKLAVFSIPQAAIAEAVEVVEVTGRLNTPDQIIQVDSLSSSDATIADVLVRYSNLSIVRSGGAGQSAQIFLRGSGSEQTLFLLNGIPINDISQPSAGFDLSTIDVNSIERIEIYKGPSSLRFGGGAIGGVINIMTKKIRLSKNLAGSLLAGSFGAHQESICYSDGTKPVRYALSVINFESSGISAYRSGEELDGHRRQSVVANIQYGDFDFTSRLLSAFSELDFSTIPDDPSYTVKSHSLGASLRHNYKSDGFLSQTIIGRESLARYYSSSLLSEKRVGDSFSANQVSEVSLNSDLELEVGPNYRQERSFKQRSSGGLFAILKYQPGEYYFEPGLRQDFYQDVGFVSAGHLALGLRKVEQDIKLKLASAYKAPSIFQLYDPAFGNSELKMEKVLGTDLTLTRRNEFNSEISLTGFYYQYKDLIQFSNRYENIGRALTKGVEVEIKKSGFEAAYTYLDARSLTAGSSLLRRPFHSWRIGAAKNITRRFDFNISYHGKSQRPDVDAVSFQRTQVNGYDLLDLGLAYKFSHEVSARFDIQNAFGKNYEAVSGYGAPGLAVYGTISFGYRP